MVIPHGKMQGGCILVSLISVHVAKAGGTALGRALQNAFGASFRAEYNDNPADPVSQRNIDPKSYFERKELLPNDITAVHGHFHPGKFAQNTEVAFSTLLRHPVDNLISIYFYWKSVPIRSDRLHDYVIDNDLDIYQVAHLPLIRYLLSKTYFGNFDMRRFDIVGRYEDRETFIQKLSAISGRNVDLSNRINTTPPSIERARIEGDHSVRRKLTDILLEDVNFYETHAR